MALAGQVSPPRRRTAALTRTRALAAEALCNVRRQGLQRSALLLWQCWLRQRTSGGCWSEYVLQKHAAEPMGLTVSEDSLELQAVSGAAQRCGLADCIGQRLTHVNGRPCRDPAALSAAASGATRLRMRFTSTQAGPIGVPNGSIRSPDCDATMLAIAEPPSPCLSVNCPQPDGQQLWGSDLGRRQSKETAASNLSHTAAVGARPGSFAFPPGSRDARPQHHDPYGGRAQRAAPHGDPSRSLRAAPARPALCSPQQRRPPPPAELSAPPYSSTPWYQVAASRETKAARLRRELGGGTKAERRTKAAHEQLLQAEQRLRTNPAAERQHHRPADRQQQQQQQQQRGRQGSGHWRRVGPAQIHPAAPAPRTVQDQFLEDIFAGRTPAPQRARPVAESFRQATAAFHGSGPLRNSRQSAPVDPVFGSWASSGLKRSGSTASAANGGPRSLMLHSPERMRGGPHDSPPSPGACVPRQETLARRHSAAASVVSRQSSCRRSRSRAGSVASAASLGEPVPLWESGAPQRRPSRGGSVRSGRLGDDEQSAGLGDSHGRRGSLTFADHPPPGVHSSPQRPSSYSSSPHQLSVSVPDGQVQEPARATLVRRAAAGGIWVCAAELPGGTVDSSPRPSRPPPTADWGSLLRGVTHVLSFGREAAVLPPEVDGVERASLVGRPVSEAFAVLRETAGAARARGGSVLLHCSDGRGRALAATCAWLMADQRMSRADAISAVSAAARDDDAMLFDAELGDWERRLRDESQRRSSASRIGPRGRQDAPPQPAESAPNGHQEPAAGGGGAGLREAASAELRPPPGTGELDLSMGAEQRLGISFGDPADELRVEWVTPGGAADAAGAGRFVGRRLVAINGRTLSCAADCVQALEQAAPSGGRRQLRLRFSDASPAPSPPREPAPAAISPPPPPPAPAAPTSVAEREGDSLACSPPPLLSSARLGGVGSSPLGSVGAPRNNAARRLMAALGQPTL